MVLLGMEATTFWRPSCHGDTAGQCRSGLSGRTFQVVPADGPDNGPRAARPRQPCLVGRTSPMPAGVLTDGAGPTLRRLGRCGQ